MADTRIAGVAAATPPPGRIRLTQVLTDLPQRIHRWSTGVLTLAGLIASVLTYFTYSRVVAEDTARIISITLFAVAVVYDFWLWFRDRNTFVVPLAPGQRSRGDWITGGKY